MESGSLEQRRGRCRCGLGATSHLPTIHEFARAAGVSAGTVMTAWTRVRDTGRPRTRRGGTVAVVF